MNDLSISSGWSALSSLSSWNSLSNLSGLNSWSALNMAYLAELMMKWMNSCWFSFIDVLIEY